MKKDITSFFLICVAMLLGISGCGRYDLTIAPQINPDDSLQIAELDTLYASVSVRKARGIIPHLKSPFPLAKQLAWRALHATPVSSDTLFSLVEQDEGDLRWFALAGHNLTDAMLDSLQSQWLTLADQRSGISLVLGMQGNEDALKFLLNHLDQVRSVASEFQNALALSRLYLHFPDSPSFYPSLIDHILNSPDSVCHAYLYAAYRSHQNLFPDSLDKKLVESWKSGLFARDRLTRQMVIHILAKHRDRELFTLLQNVDHLIDVKANEANEWIDALTYYPVDDTTASYYQALLEHPNKAVLGHLLDTMADRKLGNSLLTDQVLAIADSSKSDDPFVFVKAVKVVSEAIDTLSNPYRDDLRKAVSKNHYLLGDVLKIRSRILSRKDYLRNLELLSLEPDPYTAEQAIDALSEYWLHSGFQAKDTLLVDYTAVINQILQHPDRGKIAELSELLSDSLLIKTVTFPQIERVIRSMSFPGDIESIEAVTPVIWDHFGEKGKALIDSLASLGYPPYSRFLDDRGYENVPPVHPARYPLFRPDFKRLALAGAHPTWKLHTNRGNITVELNSYSAPATVTLIDSLSRSGAYRDVPFHRVVPNFVIQGGDFARGDGFGGTKVPLPTEPSEREFDRGAAGIASAGTDTEGPQFFFMNQWKPHLDGKYTRFGKVTSGMGVIDRIIPGDRIISDTLIYDVQ